jgi:hypothetical protein
MRTIPRKLVRMAHPTESKGCSVILLIPAGVTVLSHRRWLQAAGSAILPSLLN